MRNCFKNLEKDTKKNWGILSLYFKTRSDLNRFINLNLYIVVYQKLNRLSINKLELALSYAKM